MKTVFTEAINGGNYDLATMLNRIDYHHIRGTLTDEEREALVDMARQKAQPFGGLNVAEKLQELELRISTLEKSKEADTETGGAVPEFVPGKWYHNGNAARYKGKNYVCTAPDGVVCVWSPEEYPDYWELDE